MNGLDIAVVSSNWLQTGPQPLAGDVNADGVVNGLDISLISSDWLDKAGPLSITAPADSQPVAAGGTLAVNGIALSDPYLPTSDNVTLSLIVTNGTLSISTSIPGGIASNQVTDDGAAAVTITAPMAAISATLADSNGLAYTPTDGFSGSDTLALSGSDPLGNSDSISVPITVAGPLSITTPTGPSAVDENATLALNGITLFDPSLPTSDNVTVSLVVTDDTLSLSTSITGGIASNQVTGNDTGSVTVTAPLAAIMATLADANGLTYTPTSGFSGTDTLALSASDPLGNNNSASVSIDVVGPPSVTIPAGPLAVDGGGTLVVSGVSIADSFLLSNNSKVQVALAVQQGTLNVSTTVNGGVTSGQVAQDGGGTVVLTGTLAAINATLADPNGLSYTPASGYAGTDTLTATISDLGNTGSGVAQTASQSVSIEIGGGPTVTVPSTPLAIDQGGTLSVSGITVADGSLLASADSVQLSLAVSNGTVNLSTAVSGGITSDQVTGNGTPSVTITAPLASINATLADTSGLTYTPNSGFSGTDSLAISVSDLGNNSSGMAQTASQNLPITVAGPLAITTRSGTQAVATNGTLVVSGLLLADPSLPTADNVTMTLAVANGTIALSTAVSSGVTSNQVAGNGTSNVTITAPLPAINATLADDNGLTYAPISFFTGSDALALSAADPLGNSSSANVPITVVGPLSITAPSGTQAVATGGTLVVSGIALSDPSLPTSDNVTITLAVTNGTVSLSTAVSGGIASNQITGSGTASVTVTAPLAAINVTLADANGLAYTPTSGYSGSDTLALSASDPLGNSNSATVSITVVGPIAVTVPSGQQAVGTNGAASVTGVSVSDPRLPTTDNVTVTLSVANGTATLSTSVTNGVSSAQVTSNGTNDVTVTASLAAIDTTFAATNGLVYRPTIAFNGSDTLSVAASDTLGNSGSGSVSLAVAGPLTITVPAGQQAATSGTALAISGASLADAGLPTADNLTVTLSVAHGTATLSTAVAGGITSASHGQRHGQRHDHGPIGCDQCDAHGHKWSNLHIHKWL